MNTSYKQLTRSATHRVFTGLCGGLGEYFNIDPTIVRLLFVLGFFAGLHCRLAFWNRDRLLHYGTHHPRRLIQTGPINSTSTIISNAVPFLLSEAGESASKFMQRVNQLFELRSYFVI